MATYEITWSMYGTAEVVASSPEEATKYAASELIGWGGFGTDLEDVSVDGVDVQDA